MRHVTLAALVVAISGCGDSYFMGIDAGGFVSRQSTVYRRGDTITAVATEYDQHPYAGYDESARSDANPERFTWSTDDPAIATVDGNGRVFMKAPGQTWVRIKTAHISDAFRIIVVGPGDDIELTPHELTMAPGAVAPFTLRFVDSTRVPYDWSTDLYDTSHSATDPEHPVNSTSGGSWYYYPRVAGDITVAIAVAVRHGSPLRDTAIVRAR